MGPCSRPAVGWRHQESFHGRLPWESAWALGMSRARFGKCGGWGGIRRNTEVGAHRMHAGNDKMGLSCSGVRLAGRVPEQPGRGLWTWLQSQ